MRYNVPRKMKTKNKNPAVFVENKKLSPIIEFYFELNHLKQLFRQGWLLRGIPEDKCESVADHLFGASILTLFIADTHEPSLDLNKLLRMSLVHELGEIYLGDITPRDYIPKQVKYEWELKTVIKLFSKLPNGQKYITLWKEYEEGLTKEAVFMRQIDILEAALQSVVYRLQHNNKKVEDFIPWTRRRIKNKTLLQFLDEIEKLVPKT